jgi:hypothetical protein
MRVEQAASVVTNSGAPGDLFVAPLVRREIGPEPQTPLYS